MTTVDVDSTADIEPPGGPPAAGHPSGGSPMRTALGHTTIAPRVAEKIARRAAGETAGVCGAVTGGLSALLAWARGGSPEAAYAELGTDDSVAVELTISVRYPDPVGDVTRRVREHVVERLGACTGLRVTAVDILVASLVPERPGERRVR